MSADATTTSYPFQHSMEQAAHKADALKRELIASAEKLTPQNIKRVVKGLPLKARTALRLSLALPKGTLTVQMPDGRVVTVGGNAPGPDAVVILHNWKLPQRALLNGTIGVGESYMDGDWDSPDVMTFLKLFLVNEDWGNRLATSGFLMRLHDRLSHWFRRNTRTQARRNIAAHYDLGNRFYEQWLDASMTYSSGIYDGKNIDLQAAQTAKYRRIAKATGLRKTDSVLEIGCGWGGFAEYAAREIGCQVTCLTISREQFDYARNRIRTAGLQDRVTIKFQDYRDETGTYDKIVSIEMFEAVGEAYWDVYFGKLSELLKPGGKAGLQVITINDRSYELYRRQPDFIQRYIFPGGMLPSPTIMETLQATAGLSNVDTFIFPQDYADTLAAWRDRFWAAWPTIKPMGFDERFKRMWEFYFHYCEAGFRAEFIDVRQIVYQKPSG